jgi:hypothetical protein
MVLMIAIDDSEGYREAGWTFIEEGGQNRGEAAEIAAWDRRLDPIGARGRRAGLRNQVESAMAITEGEDQHG